MDNEKIVERPYTSPFTKKHFDLYKQEGWLLARSEKCIKFGPKESSVQDRIVIRYIFKRKEDC